MRRDEMHTPKRADAPTSAREAAGRIDLVTATAATAGVELPKAFTKARDDLNHTRDLIRDFTAARADAENPTRISEALVSGAIDLAEATQRAMVATVVHPGGLNSAPGLLHQAVSRTDGAATRHAWQAAGAAIDGDRILTDCREVVAQVIDDVRDLRKLLDGVSTDAQAARAGAKAAAAWATYLRLIDQWDAAHHLVYLLRREHWIAPLPTPVKPRYAPQLHVGRQHGRRYGQPWILADRLAAEKKHGAPFLHLLDPASDEAEPGGPYTEAEDLDYWNRREEHHTAEHAADEAELARRRGQAVRQAA